MSEFKIAIIAGEESGDQLGAELIKALNEISPNKLTFAGLGGRRMSELGVLSFFPMSEISVMGFSAVIKKLPSIIRRAYELVRKVNDFSPDLLIIIDSPDFTHPVARRIKKKLPNLPILNYISPSVWAWRPGRAKKMQKFIDHVLAVLPFEPESYVQLGGPPCTYVGHPLVKKIAQIKVKISQPLPSSSPELLLMPGSRMSELDLLLEPFEKTVDLLLPHFPDLKIRIPAVPHLQAEIERRTSTWQTKPQILIGEDAKFDAFETASCALVASGTATLELALWNRPITVAYKLDPIAKRLKWLGQVDSIVLPNLILGQNVVPEFVDDACTPQNLYASTFPLLTMGSPERALQNRAFSDLWNLCSVAPFSPAEKAARLVLDYLPDY